MMIAATIQCIIDDPYNSPNETHVYSHGAVGKICPAGQSCQSGSDFYDNYKNKIGNSGSIYLNSCYGGYGGVNSAAQSLATRSTASVTAYDNLTWYDAQKGMTGSAASKPSLSERIVDFFFGESHRIDAAGRPQHSVRDTSNPGNRRTFNPKI